MKNIISIIIGILVCFACEKNFLNAKPDKSLLVPTNLSHYQALLDNSLNIMNRTPYLGEIASDNFSMLSNSFDSYAETERNAYIWANKIYASVNVFDWDQPYKQIFYANIVLEGLKKFPNDDPEVVKMNGAARFYRGWALFQIAQIFAEPYNPETASKIKGIPIRIVPDITQASHVGTLQETYNQIRNDLQSASQHLQIPITALTRPSRTAAYAALARLHLIMQDYQKAKMYADSTLEIQNELLNYNLLDSLKAYPFPVLYGNREKNPEIIFLSLLGSNNFMNTNSNTIIDTSVYNLYSENDLRKALFFTKNKAFRGSYMGERSYHFSGLAVDEMYLIRSEANIRIGNIAAANNDLNSLLQMRTIKGKFYPSAYTTSDDLLHRILEERRKELIGRGIRWTDLRRLNQDPLFEKVIKRKIEGKEYLLYPNDGRYTFPIPDSEKRS